MSNITVRFTTIDRSVGAEAFNVQADNFAASMELAAPQFAAAEDNINAKTVICESSATTATTKAAEVVANTALVAANTVEVTTKNAEVAANAALAVSASAATSVTAAASNATYIQSIAALAILGI